MESLGHVAGFLQQRLRRLRLHKRWLDAFGTREAVAEVLFSPALVLHHSDSKAIPACRRD